MKRIVVMVCAVLGLALSTQTCHAQWGSMFYSGYQPWYNIFAKRYKCLTPEEERLQKFWHDYYDALRSFYKSLDAVDWVAYYKNHGYQINGACGPNGNCGSGGRINYAPVFVTPTLQWAVPAGMAGGPPSGPPGGYAGGPPPGPVPAGYPGPMPAGGPMPMGGPGLMPMTGYNPMAYGPMPMNYPPYPYGNIPPGAMPMGPPPGAGGPMAPPAPAAVPNTTPPAPPPGTGPGTVPPMTGMGG